MEEDTKKDIKKEDVKRDSEENTKEDAKTDAKDSAKKDIKEGEKKDEKDGGNKDAQKDIEKGTENDEKKEPEKDAKGHVKKDIKDEIILELKDVKKSFGSTDVLKDVNIKVKKGETIVVLGKSGTGKSVILKCIIGLIFPDAGDIIAFGENMGELDEDELNKLRLKMGFLFQGGALYDSMPVRENLEFTLKHQPKFKDSNFTELIEKSLTSVGLLSAIDKMPSEISGGMKKRIALARTIILEPEIILYDEPTTGLDPVTSRDISKLILQMQLDLKVTSIVVTHDMPCAKIVSDRIVVLKEGVFFAEGTYEELEKSDDEFVRGFFEFD